MRTVNKVNHLIKGTLSIGAVIAGMGSTQAAQRPAIDPMTFCLNSCNDRCNSVQDTLAPKLKAQCEKMCANKIDQVASLQMSKMPGTMGKDFRTSRDAAAKKQMMMENAPIYKCLGAPVAAAANVSVAPKPLASRAPMQNTNLTRADTRSAAQRESDENYEASLKATGQEPVPVEAQPDASMEGINQDIQSLKEEINDIAAKLDGLAEKINSAQGQ